MKCSFTFSQQTLLIHAPLLRLACNFIKIETLAQVFFCEFCEISKNTFFTEHLRWLLLDPVSNLQRMYLLYSNEYPAIKISIHYQRVKFPSNFRSIFPNLTDIPPTLFVYCLSRRDILLQNLEIPIWHQQKRIQNASEWNHIILSYDNG